MTVNINPGLFVVCLSDQLISKSVPQQAWLASRILGPTDGMVLPIDENLGLVGRSGRGYKPSLRLTASAKKLGHSVPRQLNPARGTLFIPTSISSNNWNLLTIDQPCLPYALSMIQANLFLLWGINFAIGFVGTFLGLTIGERRERNRWKKDAVARGYAEYDSISGRWRWKSEIQRG